MTTTVYKSVNGTVGSGSGGGGTPFVQSFDSGASWGAPSGGLYSIVIAQTTHDKGIDPIVQVYETVAGVDTLVEVDTVEVNQFGDVTIKVTQTLDARFAGKVVIT